jgi:adenylate cyclase
MADVVDGTVPPETFKDKIVLVGATALAIGDLRNTPFRYVERQVERDGEVVKAVEDAAYMGVEIHANVLDNLLHYNESGRGPVQRGWNEEMLDIAFLLLFGLGFGYLFARLRPLYSTLAVIAAVAGFAFLVYVTFSLWAMWLFFVLPAGTLVLNYLAVTSFRMAVEEREKRKIRKTFGQYVSPAVIALIEKNPKLLRTGGEMKELTIMFSDIRSFTTIAEGLTPDELVHLLNEYLGEMTDILFKSWGTLDKYIGDAIMAFWGSPIPQDDHAIRGCTCALEMSARLDELNLKWEVEGKKQINIGIGLNSGPVNVGNMGSDKRYAWTVMGDEVNLSSRLEGTTKTYHVRIIVAENTYQVAREQFVFRELDRIKVKGKLKPVAIYELMAFRKDAPSYQDLLTRFAEALASYRGQRWEEAIHKFEALLERYPDDGPAHVFLKRCHDKRREAPEPVPDWDGVYEMKEK